MRRNCARFLRTGPFSDQGRTYPWLVEAFQPGEQYRVDGVCRDGRVVFAAVALYVNTHLDFLGGGYMGSVMLPADSRRHRPSSSWHGLHWRTAYPASTAHSTSRPS